MIKYIKHIYKQSKNMKVYSRKFKLIICEMLISNTNER